MNGRGSSKETHHFELSLAGSNLAYEPGDALGIYPTNAPDVINDLLKALHFSGQEQVNINDQDYSLFEALFRHYEGDPDNPTGDAKICGIGKKQSTEPIIG